MNNDRSGHHVNHPLVADHGVEGSAVDQLTTGEGATLDKTVEKHSADQEKLQNDQASRVMSANELEGAIRGMSDRRGSDDSSDGNHDDGRGSEDSLAAEGINMEKQETEGKEKGTQGVGSSGIQDEAGGYSVIGGAGERRTGPDNAGPARPGGNLSDRSDKSLGASPGSASADGKGGPGRDGEDEGSQGLPFVTPITLEVGQVMFAPAPPPVSTAMPILRSKSRDSDTAADDGGETAPERDTQAVPKLTSSTGSDVVEDVHEQYFDAVQDRSMGASENGKGTAGKTSSVNGDDADDEHVSSVSDGENNESNDKLDDETFPLRTYTYGQFSMENVDPSLDRLAERRNRLSSGGHDNHSVSSGCYEDGASSVVSDIYSPRLQQFSDKTAAAVEADELAAQSYNRFKAGMPKFSSKAYSFGKKYPLTNSTTVANTATSIFDNLPLGSYGSNHFTKAPKNIANRSNEDPGNSEQPLPPPPPPTPRDSYGENQLIKSEGYYLDNYSDVITWRLPARHWPRYSVDVNVDDLMEVDEDTLETLDQDQHQPGTDEEEDEDQEKDFQEDEDDDDKTNELGVDNKEDENAKEKVGKLGEHYY
ncbi:hypothetical protein PoB_006100100 [Plakobranchus ocellatus]|uniref:Uncharacterized protein n=1 Tax=Plakobranchus ocellatus TaxID=259542 RepID=A0AAV4CRH1_9GAST|nr:hypothetical protein PoB_006100100 [Plakobranchus ocellatus]